MLDFGIGRLGRGIVVVIESSLMPGTMAAPSVTSTRPKFKLTQYRSIRSKATVTWSLSDLQGREASAQVSEQASLSLRTCVSDSLTHACFA